MITPPWVFLFTPMFYPVCLFVCTSHSFYVYISKKCKFKKNAYALLIFFKFCVWSLALTELYIHWKQTIWLIYVQQHPPSDEINNNTVMLSWTSGRFKGKWWLIQYVVLHSTASTNSESVECILPQSQQQLKA